MGRGFRGNARGHRRDAERNRRKGGGRGGGWRNDSRPEYGEIEKKNEGFEKYYNELGVVPEEEREAFWEYMRKELPNSFRFAGSKGHALAVQQRLIDRYIPQITSVKYEGKFVEAPTPIEWFPEKLAWQMSTPKNVIRKFAPFASFQKFLVSETSVGNISRQEIVSMIPPLVMDVKPGMTVLDMCAAPGSKSAQLIEMIHGGEEARMRKVLRQIVEREGREMSPDGIEVEAEKMQIDAEDDWSDDGRATGLLIANDADYRRAQMLVHQVKRLSSPNMMVVNHDATMFPSIKIPSEPGKQNQYLKFDRILADVPCSGDGTCRKNRNVWKDWIPGNGLGLHITQVRILVRALQMLKVGGRVVYSTCSMNPVENEAVVGSAIDRCGGAAKVRIVNCSDKLPGLKRAKGLKQWKVIAKNGTLWGDWDSIENAKADGKIEGMGKLVAGMFPPQEQMPLENCMRVYPHMQDTGGFFITVLEKLSEIKARPENESKQPAVDPKTAPIAALQQELEAKVESGAEFGTADSKMDGLETANFGADAGNPGSAARQNKENTPEASSPLKRALDMDEDENLETSSKRFKLADGDRQEHLPIPPAAEPDRVNADGNLTTLEAIGRPQVVEKRNRNQGHEEAFKYLDPDHPALRDIYEFYELSPRFPRDRYMVRNATGEPAKAIYYTSALGRDILTENEGKGMKFVHCGVKMFMKQDVQKPDVCRWRIQSEGMFILEPWVGKGRVVRCWKRGTLHKLLKEMFPKIAQEGWQKLGEIGERCRDISMGCCVLRVETSDAEDGFTERMVLPLWRSLSSMNLMLPKEERKAMLLRLYNDTSELIDHSADFKDKHGQKKPELPQQPSKEELLKKEAKATAKLREGDNGGVVDADEDKEDGGVPLPADINNSNGGGDANTNGGPQNGQSISLDAKLSHDVEDKAMEVEDRIRADGQQAKDD